MSKDWNNSRFIKSNFIPLLLGILFLAVFYGIYFTFWKNIQSSIESYKVNEFMDKYWIFIPILYWIILTIILYILYFIKWIIRIDFWLIKVFLIIIVYWISLFFWIQLLFFEPRYTDIAIYIIDNYSKSIIWASTFVMIATVIMIFIKSKEKKD